jgi:cytochrome c oxidase assembly protein Cox11
MKLLAHGVMPVGLSLAVVSLQALMCEVTGEAYGTDNVIVWLLVSLPDVAVTAMV